jgi:hypothetical protein
MGPGGHRRPDIRKGSDPDRPLVFFELDVAAIRTLHVAKPRSHEIVLTW